ncbi:hypothetical protein ACFIOY_17375 [Bradyrhizobium sp. TZ2]
MRFLASILSLLLTAILLCASIAAAPGEDRPGDDVQQEVRQKYDGISFAGGDFEISIRLWCRNNSRLPQNS